MSPRGPAGGIGRDEVPVRVSPASRWRDCASDSAHQRQRARKAPRPRAQESPGRGALERPIHRKIEAESRNADIMRGFTLDGSPFVVQRYNPAPKTMPPTVKTPGADIGPLANDPTREAVDSMRGYSYQVLCSVLAWVDLSEGELLFLEGAEDFDHIAGDTATATQVRDTRGSSSRYSSFSRGYSRLIQGPDWSGTSWTGYRTTCSKGSLTTGSPGIGRTDRKRPGKSRR